MKLKHLKKLKYQKDGNVGIGKAGRISFHVNDVAELGLTIGGKYDIYQDPTDNSLYIVKSVTGYKLSSLNPYCYIHIKPLLSQLNLSIPLRGMATKITDPNIIGCVISFKKKL